MNSHIPETQSVPNPEVAPIPESEPAKGHGLQLPEPDRHNITVLLHNLPQKPVLPWNRYDSPWQEESDLGTDAEPSEPQSPEALEDPEGLDPGDEMPLENPEIGSAEVTPSLGTIEDPSDSIPPLDADHEPVIESTENLELDNLELNVAAGLDPMPLDQVAPQAIPPTIDSEYQDPQELPGETRADQQAQAPTADDRSAHLAPDPATSPEITPLDTLPDPLNSKGLNGSDQDDGDEILLSQLG